MNDNNLTKIDNTASRFLQGMFDASIHGIIILAPVYDVSGEIEDFIVRAANKAVKEHLGIEAEYAIDKQMTYLVPNYKRYGFFKIYVNTFYTKQTPREELYYKDDRIEGWYEIGVATNEDTVVVSFANITKYKLYQQQIERSATRLDAIINTSQSGIFVFKPVFESNGELTDFIFTKANPALAAYVRQKQEDVIGSKGSTYFPAYKTNGLFNLYSETYLTGKTNHFEFHYDGDNIDVWLDILSTKMDDEVLVTFTDHTPVKRLQLELEKFVEDLKRSNENLEEFAYVASHDLQEPLRKIQYYGDRLNQLCSDNPDARTMLQRMGTSIARMRSLIEDLLAYSRFSSKRNSFEPVDLNKLLQEVFTDLETSILEKNASINVQPLPVIEGDRLQLRQLFQNIISNALKYNKAGVPLKIQVNSQTISGASCPGIIPSHLGNHKFYSIEVIDNGIGFDQVYAKKIFKIFQRLHGRSEYPGTGVGLAIVQKVVENHNGYVHAQGVLGEGANFNILLPIEPLKPANTPT